MSKVYNFLAFDIGATSGRSILGRIENGVLKLEELTRFPNDLINIQGKLYWNIYSLYESLKTGIKTAATKGIEIDSIGIDTWAVDFVYISEQGSIIELPRAYRDPYTEGMPAEFFKLLSRKEVYNETGIQIMNFNTLFQLYAAKKENSFALKSAKEILFIPDALSYLLTGIKVCEHTVASTSQLINPRTKEISSSIYKALDLPPLLSKEISPGQKIGNLYASLAKECGTSEISVIAVAGHDTASAVVSMPSQNENVAYISSGTWSLMGIEVKAPIINDASFNHNFTNEGGVDGTTRFLKNIAGMWLLEECRRQWLAQGNEYTYSHIVQLAESAKPFASLVDPDDASFACPVSMIDSIKKYCQKTNQQVPQTEGEIIRCIFDSLALKYKYVFKALQEMAPFAIETMHVIGGGSQNALLNQMTANALAISVVAGPSEATAIGNIMIQAKGVGVVKSLDEIRQVIRVSSTLTTFTPRDTENWDSVYDKYLKIIKLQ